MNLLDGIKKNNTSVSINGSKYYDTSYNSNLDVFTMITRFNYEPNVINLFNNALIENEELALANLLYILDIREGKGEQRMFGVDELGMDLGTSTLHIVVRGKGIVLELDGYVAQSGGKRFSIQVELKE